MRGYCLLGLLIQSDKDEDLVQQLAVAENDDSTYREWVHDINKKWLEHGTIHDTH